MPLELGNWKGQCRFTETSRMRAISQKNLEWPPSPWALSLEQLSRSIKIDVHMGLLPVKDHHSPWVTVQSLLLTQTWPKSWHVAGPRHCQCLRYHCGVQSFGDSLACGLFHLFKMVILLPISSWGHSTMPAVKQMQQLGRGGKGKGEEKSLPANLLNTSSLKCWHLCGNRQEQTNLLEEASCGLPGKL